jgi:MFS family permease
MWFRGSALRGFDRRLWVLFVGRVISAAGFSIVLPFLSIYLNKFLGLPMTDIGLLFLGTAVVGALGNLVGGELADRLGRRPVIWTSLGLRGVIFIMVSVVITLSSNFYLLSILIMASSFMGSLFEPAANAMVADMVGPGRRTEAYGLIRVGQNIGWTLGPLMGGLLALFFSYSLLFLFSAVASIAASLLFLMMVAEPPRADGLNERFSPRDLLRVRKSPLFMLLCLSSLPLFIVLGQMTSTFAVFSETAVGISTAEIGYLFAINGIMVVLFQLPLARFIARFKMSYVLAFGAALYAIGYFIMPWAGNFWLLSVSMAITTMGEITTSASGMNLVANLSPDKERGRYMGVFGLFSSFGWSIGPFVGGILYDVFIIDPVMLWSSVSLIAILSMIGFIHLGTRCSDRYDRMNEQPALAKD